MPNVKKALMGASGAGGGGAVRNLFVWGKNNKGQLGLGDTTNRSSPVQVGSLSTWATGAVSQYTSHTMAIKTDGTMWSWGRNNQGQLGLGNLTDTSSPVQIGALTTWRQVAAATRSGSAITTGGDAFSWGTCIYGNLGQGNSNTATSSPVLLSGAQGQWYNIFMSGFQSGGLKKSGSDITMFTWGNAFYGGTGQGNTTNLSNPTQLGSLTDWKLNTREINGVTQYFSPAGASSNMIPNIHVKSDGTLWAWGIGNNGQRGDGVANNTNSSPIQIGSSTNWTQAYFASTQGAAFEY